MYKLIIFITIIVCIVSFIYGFIGGYNDTKISESEKIEVLCLAMANLSIDRVMREHKYDKQVYENFQHQFNFECNRMLKMRIGFR